jgi:tetratricopeptide (TPR) repeat protein
MKEDHLSQREIRQLIEVEISEMQTKLLLHHLAVCPECYAAGGYLLDLHEAGMLPPRFSSVDIDLAKSRAAAPALYQRLSRFSFEHQKGLLNDTRRFRSFGLAEILCAESLKAGARDPGKAIELAELAVLLASLLREWQPVEEAWLCLLRSFAWAHLGNARRIVEELRSAEDAFAEADRWWQASDNMGDVLDYEPTILALKASLRRTQGRFAEALALLATALDAGAAGQLKSHILASRAYTLGEAGETDASVEAFREALAATDRLGSPRLFYILHHNLLDALSKAGRYKEAELLLPEVRSLSRETGEVIDGIRLRWIEGRLAGKLGHRDQAAKAFAEVRGEFLGRGLLFDAALAALEEATLYLAEGEYQAVEEISGELLAVFEAHELPRETYATVLVFFHAARARVATAELAAAAIESLERARNLRSDDTLVS